MKARGAVLKQVFSLVQASPRSYFHTHAHAIVGRGGLASVREEEQRASRFVQLKSTSPGFKRCTTPVFIPEPTCHRKHDQRFFNSERLDRVKAAPPRCHSCRSARTNNFWHTWTSLGTSFPSRWQLRMIGSILC